jgi:lipoprotein-anchoring transpeptidase ErfK/SrfK
MKPVKTQLTLIGIFILLAYSLGLADPDEESSDSTKIVIIRAANTLYLYNGDTIIKSYKIAVGKKTTPTPLGQFRIVNRIVNPGWFPQGKDPVPAGVTANPVGTRWMGLSEKGYGIHGTNKPSSIGKMASKGCIRMKNKDIEDLFALVKVGTPVEIIESQESTAVVEKSPEIIVATESTPVQLVSRTITE